MNLFRIPLILKGIDAISFHPIVHNLQAQCWVFRMEPTLFFLETSWISLMPFSHTVRYSSAAASDWIFL